MLAGCLLGTLPLELVLHTRVYARPGRLLMTLLPVVAVFVVWDVLAIRAGHWSYDPGQVSGIRFGNLPLEELAFFVVIPICAVLTLEAVRAVRGWRPDRESGWLLGDEPAVGAGSVSRPGDGSTAAG